MRDMLILLAMIIGALLIPERYDPAMWLRRKSDEWSKKGKQ